MVKTATEAIARDAGGELCEVLVEQLVNIKSVQLEKTIARVRMTLIHLIKATGSLALL